MDRYLVKCWNDTDTLMYFIWYFYCLYIYLFVVGRYPVGRRNDLLVGFVAFSNIKVSHSIIMRSVREKQNHVSQVTLSGVTSRFIYTLRVPLILVMLQECTIVVDWFLVGDGTTC